MFVQGYTVSDAVTVLMSSHQQWLPLTDFLWHAPLQAAVTCVAVSPDSACVASCAADGSVFFLALDLAAGPEAFLQPVAGTRLAAGSGSISGENRSRCTMHRMHHGQRMLCLLS